MNHRFKQILSFGIPIGLFAAVILLLHKEMEIYRFGDVLAAVHAIAISKICGVCFLTFIGYFLMTAYDTMAMRYIEFDLPYRKISMASFIGYAFSNNIGLSMIAGASVRYRFYSSWGLSTSQVTRVVFFCLLSIWFGFLTTAGLVFLFDPPPVPHQVDISVISLRLIGLLLLGVVLLYTVYDLLNKRPLQIKGHEIQLIPIRFLAPQIVIGMCDWVIAGFILFVLLGATPELPFSRFLGTFLLAQILGLVSQVPGGLGVFESIVVLSLSPIMPTPRILGGLLAYRVVYYWMPLIIASVLLGGQELLRARKKARKFVALFGSWVSPVIPNILGLAVFLAGTILLISGATPGIDQRLLFLKHYMPLIMLEFSHFLGSLIGMGLLLLGWGLNRRLDVAYLLAVIGLAAGIVASLVKGFDYEEACILLLILMALLPSRRHFYRKASFFSQPFDGAWISAILIVLGCSIWIGFYSYRHIRYQDALWWKFTFSGNASRFLRATLGVLVMGLFFAIARLMRPKAPKSFYLKENELDHVAAIVDRCSETSANLALLGDKLFLFNQNEDAFIMYGVEGRSWISMGDPVGSMAAKRDLIWQFVEYADRYGGWPVFYEVGHEHLYLYLDAGLNPIKIGEQARVLLPEFSLDGSARKGFRNIRNKFEKEGYCLDILEPDQVSDRLSELKAVSNDWLEHKHTREKGFSLGAFKETYIRRYKVAAIYKDDQITAFANLWLGAGKTEASVDLMRFRLSAPNGIMDYLFCQIMLWARSEGYQWFNLGMAPLSGFETRSLAPIWNRIGAFVFKYGEHFYNFRGLRQYKEKFDPVWAPRYMACPGRLALPMVFANLSALISGGIKGVVAK